MPTLRDSFSSSVATPSDISSDATSKDIVASMRPVFAIPHPVNIQALSHAAILTRSTPRIAI
jgi:hypothetical protein